MSNEPTDRPPLERFFSACDAGDISGLRQLLRDDPALVGERIGGTTGLHRAVQHPAAVAVLLEHGADPNARDVDDSALPLHFAASAFRTGRTMRRSRGSSRWAPSSRR